jgi:predicted ribosome quality control (RQC) complex YloA/Tae2 family protein
MKLYTLNRTEFTVGCNAAENWALLSKADKNHYWVHLDEVASAHCIIHHDEPLDEEFEYARQLILEQTKKAPRNAKIVYARVRQLKRGNKVGEVLVKTI